MAIQIRGFESAFQKDLTRHFIFLIRQVMVEIISTLCSQHTRSDKTRWCPSLTDLCAELTNHLQAWTNKSAQNEIMGTQIINAILQWSAGSPIQVDGAPSAANRLQT
jgi:hypothetical protein